MQRRDLLEAAKPRLMFAQLQVCLKHLVDFLLFRQAAAAVAGVLKGLPYELPSLSAAPVDADPLAADHGGVSADQHALMLAAGRFDPGRWEVYVVSLCRARRSSIPIRSLPQAHREPLVAS